MLTMNSTDNVYSESILRGIGKLGRYQIKTHCWILLPTLFGAVCSSQYIFAAGDISYRCTVPGSEADLSNFGFPESRGQLDRFPSLGEVWTPGNIQNLSENDNTIVPEMEYQSKSLPYLYFGVIAACSGLLMLLTPETLRTPRTKRNRTAINTSYCKATL